MALSTRSADRGDTYCLSVVGDGSIEVVRAIGKLLDNLFWVLAKSVSHGTKAVVEYDSACELHWLLGFDNDPGVFLNPVSCGLDYTLLQDVVNVEEPCRNQQTLSPAEPSPALFSYNFY